MGALHMGGRKGEVSPPSLCFYKASLDTLMDYVFRVFAESSDHCLLQKWGSKWFFFPLSVLIHEQETTWQTQVPYFGSEPVSFFFFPNIHTDSLYLLITEMLTSSPTQLYFPIFEESTEVQNKCTMWTTAKDWGWGFRSIKTAKQLLDLELFHSQ